MAVCINIQIYTLGNICQKVYELVLDIFCQMLGDICQFEGIGAPFRRTVVECAFSQNIHFLEHTGRTDTFQLTYIHQLLADYIQFQYEDSTDIFGDISNTNIYHTGAQFAVDEDDLDIPHNCHFWYTTIFFRPVKGTPKKCGNSLQKMSRDKTA